MGPCQGKGSDEQSLLRSILDTLASGDILLGDAFYATYFLLCALQERGVDGVFERKQWDGLPLPLTNRRQCARMVSATNHSENEEKSKMKISRIGVDIAKTVFHVHGVDRHPPVSG
jgi:hypothetical protein